LRIIIQLNKIVERKYIIFILICFCQISFSQIPYKLDGSLVCFDELNNISYFFDSGSEISAIFSDSVFVKSSIFKPTKFSYSFTRDALGNLVINRKIRLNVSIPKVCNVNQNLSLIQSKDPCFNNIIMLGIKEFQNSVIFINNNTKSINYKAVSPINSDDYFVISMKKEWLSGLRYVYLNVGFKKIKFLVDLGYSGGVGLKKDYDFKGYDIENRDVILSTFSEKNLIESFEIIKDIIISKKENDFKISSDIAISRRLVSNLLGVKFFIQFESVVFDFQKNILYLSKKMLPKSETRPFRLSFIEDNIVISSISHNSKIYAEGFRIGDKIKILNYDVSKFTQDEKCNIDNIYFDFIKNKVQENVSFIKIY
jgi:hypothetical protein